MDRDYIITFDENGEPYIAHALGSRLSGAASNARRAGSRYLMKIQTKYGNRYFYTPQEVQAYQRAKSGVKKAANSAKSAVNNTKKQVNQTVKTLKSDLKKRQTWKNAEKEAASPLKDVKQIDKGWYQGRIETAAESTYDKKYAEKTKKTYDKTKLGKAENAVKESVDKVKSSTKNVANDTNRAIKDKLGYDERDRLNNAKKEKEKADKRLERELKDNVSEEMLARYALGKKFNDVHEGRGLTPDQYADHTRKMFKDYDEKEAALEKAQADYDKTVLSKVEKATDKVKSTKDRMKEEFRKKADKAIDEVEEKSGIKARRELKKAEKESADAVKAYRDTERAEREMGDNFTGSKLDALRNLNDKNNAEDKAKFEYELSLLGKVEKRLNGGEDYRRHTSQEKAVDKANADFNKQELKIIANRGPIDLEHVSKEYMFSLGSNTGHNSEVKKAMTANDAYNIAKSNYNSITKNKNATATDIRLAAKEMNDAKKEYDKTMDVLSKVLNADVEEAKEKLKKSK